MRARLGFLLCILPAAVFLFWFVTQYHYVAPFGEQWGLVEAYARASRGATEWHDLWGQKNVHRIFVPKLVFFGAARFGYWNHLHECWTVFAVALVALAGQLYALRPVFSTLRAPTRGLAVVLVSGFVLSVSASENWLWGLQLQLVTCVAATSWGLALLARTRSTSGLVGALVCGFVASFSYANGLVLWPLGALSLVLTGGVRRWRALAVWIVAAALVAWAFFHGYRLPSGGTAARDGAEVGGFVRHAHYVLVFLGNPVAIGTSSASFAGGAALVTALAAGWRLVRGAAPHNDGPARSAFHTGLLFQLAGLSIALVVALGRAGKPLHQALSSRDVTLAGLFWCGLVLWLLALIGLERSKEASGPAPRGLRTVVALVLLGTVVGAAWRAPRGYENGRLLSQQVRLARDAVRATWPRVPQPVLKALNYPRPDRVAKGLPILRERDLSLFRGIQKSGRRRRTRSADR